jgi:hypothetical protein
MGKSFSKSVDQEKENKINSNSSIDAHNENSNNHDPFSILDNDKLLESLEENFKKMELSFKYFLDLKEPHELVKYKRALRSFRFLSEFCVQDSFKQRRDQFESIYKYSMVEFFSNLTLYCYPHVKQFVSENIYLSDSGKSNDAQFKLLKIKFLLMSYVAKILWNLTENKSFRYKFHENKGTQALLAYLNDDELIRNCLRFKLDSRWQSKNDNDSPTGILFLRSLIACFHNLSKIAEMKQAEFKEMNATLILLKFAEITENHSSIRLYAYLAITNVVSDTEIETLPQTVIVLKDIIKLIKIGANSISTKSDLKRVKIDLDNGKLDLEATVIIFGLNQFNIIELLEALYKLSVNDKTKPLIYQTFEMNTILKIIIIEGNNLEKVNILQK